MTATTRNIIEELRRAATEQGAGEAVRTIAGPALETWMRALDGKDADPERLDALAAYLAWWDGDGKAATLAALAALDDDPETSLAIMVAAVAASGRYPAYLR